jgi:plastocyanin
MTIQRAAIFCLGLLLGAGSAHAADPVFNLTIRNHRFEPEQLDVPAGQKIELRVANADATAEELESGELRRQKVVDAGQTISVFVGPLRPGTYEFFGDFNPKTARGRVVAK